MGFAPQQCLHTGEKMRKRDHMYAAFSAPSTQAEAWLRSCGLVFTWGFSYNSSTQYIELAQSNLSKMAEDGVATKAPESDARQPSAISAEDTPAQHGASMGVSSPIAND